MRSPVVSVERSSMAMISRRIPVEARSERECGLDGVLLVAGGDEDGQVGCVGVGEIGQGGWVDAGQVRKAGPCLAVKSRRARASRGRGATPGW